jgi:hypothetical protein
LLHVTVVRSVVVLISPIKTMGDRDELLPIVADYCWFPIANHILRHGDRFWFPSSVTIHRAWVSLWARKLKEGTHHDDLIGDWSRQTKPVHINRPFSRKHISRLLGIRFGQFKGCIT